MTQQDAEKLTGLEAREIVAPSEVQSYEIKLLRLGDQFRFQLGRTVPYREKITVTEEDGSTRRYHINTTVFELVAFGRSYDAAVAMYRRITPAQVIPSVATPAEGQGV